MWNIILQVISFDIFATITTFICMSEYSQKSRWFLLHALSNHYIMTNSYDDMIFCLKDPVICSHTDWNDNSRNAFLMCTAVHLYHCLFFKLTIDDVLHHGMMLFICGPLAYYTNKITVTGSLFFLSGLPGLIDYTLLWVFKCLEFNHHVRKYIYLVVNLLLRSPGCLLFSYINMLTFSYEKIILYWNAQYYLNHIIIFLIYKMIKTGPRGGKYYITSGGKKQYLKYEKEQLQDSAFCGPAGGYPMGTYPVNTKERCSSALRYARHAPNPCGIARCVRDKCPEGTGKTSKLFTYCNIK